MSEDNHPRQPLFEEKAAEAELEGIRRELDETRQRRKQASEAFDAFLRSFGPRTGREPQPIGQRLPEPPPAPPRASEPQTPPLTVAPAKPPVQTPAPTAPPLMPAPVVMPAPPTRPTESPALLLPPPAASGPAASSTEPPGLPSLSTAAPTTSDPLAASPTPEPGAPVPGRADSWIPEPTTPLQIIRDNGEFDSLIPETPKAGDPGASVPRISTAPVVPAGLGALLRPPRLKRSHIGLVAVGVTVLAAIFLWPRGGEEPEAGREPTAVAPAPASAPASAAPAEAQAPAAAAGVQLELTTLRRVWLRVVVDGERTIEREVDGNQRIPVTANQSIVVRAGDAGALRVNVAGKDETFGAEGLPATRSFTRAR